MVTTNSKAELVVETFPVLMNMFHRFSTSSVARLNMTLPQFLSLSAMSIRQQWTVSELAKYLKIKPPAASELVERLVKGGFIIRKTSTKDRRISLLSLSPKGKRMFAQRRTKLMDRYQSILERLSVQQQELFVTSLQNLVELSAVLEKQEVKV